MADSKEAVIKDLKKYIAVLKENGFPIQRAMLFGSWAKGAGREESDVDVASDWERGIKKPGGPALRLLTIIQKKDLHVIA